jgi:hypothetical protein
LCLFCTASHLHHLLAACEDKDKPSYTMDCTKIGPTVFFKANDVNGGGHIADVMGHALKKYSRGTFTPASRHEG